MEKLLKLKADLDTKIRTLLTSDGQLTAEQKAEHDQLKAQLKDCKERIAALRQADEEEAKEKAEAEAAAKRAESNRLESERAARQNAGANRITQPDSEANANQTKAPTIIRHRAATPRHFTRGTLAERQEAAYRFGMFGMALLSMDIGGHYRNKAAEQWLETNLAVHQSNNATGSHVLIPEEFMADIIMLREQYGVARRLLNVQPMASDTLVRPRRASGLTAYFVAEGSAGTESNKTWNDVRLVAKDLMVISRMSAQVNADAAINFGDDLAQEITYAFSNKEDDCAFNGTGTSTYGGITGIRSAMGTAGIVTQGTSNTWSALVLADFHNTVGLLPQYADTPNAGWVCHRTFYYGVMQKLELAAGGVTAMEISAGDRRPRPLFLGYPVNFSQVFPSATATATIPIILGDLALAAMFGDRQQEGIAFSNTAVVGGESTFERNQIAIRGTERFDIVTHDVGTSSVVGPVVALKTGS